MTRNKGLFSFVVFFRQNSFNDTWWD